MSGETKCPPVVWVGYDTVTGRPVGVCENNLDPHEWAADFLAVEGVRVPTPEEIASQPYVPMISKESQKASDVPRRKRKTEYKDV